MKYHTAYMNNQQLIWSHLTETEKLIVSTRGFAGNPQSILWIFDGIGNLSQKEMIINKIKGNDKADLYYEMLVKVVSIIDNNNLL